MIGRRSVMAALVAWFILAGLAAAETKVTLSGVHLCCGGCIVGVNDAVADLKDVKVDASQKTKTVTITAKDDAAAQKAIDALAEAGYYGKLDSKAVAFKPIDVPQGKVARLELTGIHNCCGACNKAIKGAIKTVDGVTADTATSKDDSFVVEGNFEAKALVDALLAAGFHVQVKK